MRFLALFAFLVFAVLSSAVLVAPKVVIVAMFEPGNDTGDTPGEFQYWVERLKLDKVYPLPSAYHDVRSNADGSVIGIVRLPISLIGSFLIALGPRRTIVAA